MYDTSNSRTSKINITMCCLYICADSVCYMLCKLCLSTGLDFEQRFVQICKNLSNNAIVFDVRLRVDMCFDWMSRFTKFGGDVGSHIGNFVREVILCLRLQTKAKHIARALPTNRQARNKHEPSPRFPLCFQRNNTFSIQQIHKQRIHIHVQANTAQLTTQLNTTQHNSTQQ